MNEFGVGDCCAKVAAVGPIDGGCSCSPSELESVMVLVGESLRVGLVFVLL